MLISQSIGEIQSMAEVLKNAKASPITDDSVTGQDIAEIIAVSDLKGLVEAEYYLNQLWSFPTDAKFRVIKEVAQASLN